jgi:3-oxoadipate enol-lactonase
MPVSDVNGVGLYWERAGSGARLLFCNGSGATLDRARPLIDLLAAEFDLLVWDFRASAAALR